MALVKCKECKKEVSSSAKLCPHCGIKNPSTTAKDYILGAIGIIVIIFAVKACSGDDEPAKKVAEKNTVEAVKPRELGEAKPYTIISGDMKTKARKETFFVAAPLAETKGDRAATARKAASDIFEKSGIPVVTVFVEHDKLFAGKGSNLAKATYFSDACNFSGTDCNGIVWDLAASNVIVTDKEWNTYRDWIKNRSRYMDKNGDLNEEKLKAFLAKKYGIKPDDVHLPYPGIDYVGVNPYESEQDKQAEKDKAFAKKAVVEARVKKLESQFSPWDGSHRTLERAIQKSMNDPDSYEHVETTYRDMGDSLIVSTTFRGKNGFGGTVKNTVVAQVDLDGNILKVISE
jgi:RNA polymerase subunit RPABC4/transcription elongation factor Spt4